MKTRVEWKCKDVYERGMEYSGEGGWLMNGYKTLISYANRDPNSISSYASIINVESTRLRGYIAYTYILRRNTSNLIELFASVFESDFLVWVQMLCYVRTVNLKKSKEGAAME